LAGQIQGSFHVNHAKGSQGVGFLFMHHMNPSGKMNNRIAANQRLVPIGPPIE
jgi:hypothetical protein